MFRKGDEPVPGYRLEKFLGKGQFGEVWKTSAPGGTSAALKFIDLGGKQGIKEFRGVQRVKEIRHANLMPITAIWMIDAEGRILSDQLIASYNPDKIANPKATLSVDHTADSRPEWLVVAMLLGKKNLMDRLEECTESGQQGIPVEELLRYMDEAAKGIDYLNTAQHDLGEGPVALQHCDIKPANIMLIGDAAVVCDFGLARVLSDSQATATGMVGSPAYMPPECIARKPGPGSDQYALAISYVELRTGHLPFAELTYFEVMEANRSGKLDLSRLPPPEQLVIRKATSLNPADRYPSTLAMVHALHRAVEGTPETSTLGRNLIAGLAILAIAVVLPLTAWLLVPKFGGTTDQEYTLQFEPHDATVLLNAAQQKLDGEGKLLATLPLDALVSLDVSHPDYESWKQQISIEELKKSDFQIRLKHTGAYFARRAFDLLDQGDFDAAAKEYDQAVQADRAYESPEPIRLTRHTKSVVTMACTPDNKWLLSAGEDGIACLWPLADPRKDVTPVVLAGHAADNLIESIAMAPNGRWAVTGSWDDTAIVWDLSAADPATTAIKLSGHTEDVVATAITSDLRWVVSGSIDETIRLWPFVDGRPSAQGQLLNKEAAIAALRVSADGRWLVAVDIEGNANRWDLSAEKPETTKLALGSVRLHRNVLQLTPDGKWLFTGTDDGKVEVTASDKSATTQSFDCSAESIEALAMGPQGQQLFVGDTSGNVYRFNVGAEGQLTDLFRMTGHVGECVAIAIAKNGEFAVTGSWDQTARYWDLTSPSGKPPAFLTLSGQGSRVISVAISPDGKWIATATASGQILLWDVQRCKLVLRVTGTDIPRTKANVET